jgi:molybdopterin molybdotransferase
VKIKKIILYFAIINKTRKCKDRHLVSINEALQRIYDTIKPLDERETIDIIDSEGRVCAQDIIAKIDLPKFDHSAMDGYGIRMDDCGGLFECTKTLFAGDKDCAPLVQDEIIKIMTGAPIPKGVQAVVPIENIAEEDGKIKLPTQVKMGANIRQKGEELKAGSVCIKKGELINSYTIALLASQGIKEIVVFKKVNAVILSNGSELRSYQDKDIGAFEIYNSNTPMLYARLKALRCCSYVEQSVGDDLESLKKSITDAAKKNHIIITTGGASVGDKDFTKQALRELGIKMLFEKVNIKPGKPTSIGILDGTIIVSLPGNPLAAMVNFELFVSIAIAILQGGKDIYHKIIKTTFSNEYRLKPGKYSVICGKFCGENFSPLENQSPNQVSTLKEIDSFALTDPSIEHIENSCSVNIVDLKDKVDKKECLFIFP